MNFLRRLFAVLSVAAVVCAAATCSRSAAGASPHITLVTPSGGPSVVEVSGLSRAELRALRSGNVTADAWPRVLTVVARQNDGSRAPAPVTGAHAVVGDILRFTPMFPFDPGRQYDITLNRAAIPGADPALQPVAATVALPASAPPPPTFVTQIFPSGPTVPENQLRLYIHFSAPMGRRGGVEYVKLLDDSGREVEDPFLPLEAEFWNADRTRYTVFFDPGRQKRGILPNREMGPSLVEGREYSLVVRQEWTDGHGRPLRETFTRRFRVGPPVVSAIEHAKWTVAAPAAGTRDALSITFPQPLDHALLHRAIGVRRGGETITGEIRVEDSERRWLLTPRDAWQPGAYEVFALSMLEDVAGNRIGRAFEVDGFQRTAGTKEGVAAAIPFTIPAR